MHLASKGSRNPGKWTKRAFVVSQLLFVAFFSLFVSGCPLYNPAAFVKTPNSQSGPDDIALAATQTTLAWDPPASGASQVATYTVSYRIHGTSTWTTLASVPASTTPSYTVPRSSLQPSTTTSFDFEVVAVSTTGVTSPPHTSLDPTADPTSGWYLTW